MNIEFLCEPGEIKTVAPMSIELLRAPTEEDWVECKRRALVTIGKKPVNPPDSPWRHRILAARHSPIRYLVYSFYFENIPYCISVHFARHIHSQPYIKTQRNDRQHEYDRNKAPQDAPVNMILDVNAEELMTIANKRLCNQAAKETREAVGQMCRLAEQATPELKGLLVPMCEYHGGVCHEMFPCERAQTNLARIRSLPAEKLAELLVHDAEEEELDEDYDGGWRSISLRTFSVCPSGEKFDDFDDAVQHTVQWLHQKSDTQSNEANIA